MRKLVLFLILCGFYSFYNINNATKIAYDYHIPAERCLNTMGLSELKTFFSKNNV